MSKLYFQLNEKPKNYFVLVSRVPSIAVDFRTNDGLHNSINSFSFQKNFHPGHEMIGWKCKIGTMPFESMVGLSGESDDQHKDLLDKGWGLTSLLATFKDGFLQDPNELEARFHYFAEENELAAAEGRSKRIFLIATVLEITENDCERIVNETFEFVNHINNPVQNFSMILSPARYEGAGCGSFAAHFMERIDSVKSLIPLFRRQFNLPNYLFGTGSALPEGVEIPETIKNLASKKPVSKIKLISSSWTSSASPYINVEILDPELIVFWQKLFFDAYFDQNNWTKEKKSFNKNTFITRGVWESSEDIYNQGQRNFTYVAIDRNYDERTRSIYSHQTQFIKDLNLTYFTFSNFPGIILERK
ncbi:MAG: hypothetical protein JNM24_17270 [Bdellovibrionaceae bacterium]|nr:hypothetical protein [Pseudobdellovibrionaceae bacterium]